MDPIVLNVEDLENAIIPIGKVAENLCTQVQINCKARFDEYPTAVVMMAVTNPNGVSYPATIVRDGNIVKWDVKNSDLVAEGRGKIQLTFTVDSVVKKSDTAIIAIDDSIVTSGVTPDPLEDFVTEAEEVLEDVKEALHVFPKGGTKDQVLTKNSGTDFDASWKDPQGGSGTTDYDSLENKPQIAGVTLSGDKTLHDLGAAAESDIPDVSGFYTKPQTGIPASDIADDVIPDVSGFYTKPTSGIPASDIADGVIPVLTDLIDDTAGDGDTNKVWSADKSNSLLSAIANIEDVLTTDGEASTEVAIDISGTYTSGKRIALNVGVGNTVDMTPGNSSSFGYIVSDCKDGDYFTIKGVGGDAPRLWGFVDSSNKLLSVADAYATLSGSNINAPSGSKKAIFNMQGSSAHTVVKHTTTEATEPELINVKTIDKSFADSGNMFDKSTITVGKKYEDGVLVDDSTKCLSDFIEIEPNKAYTYRGVNGAINYFDEDKAYLSAESITTYDSAVTKTSVSDAKYVRLQMGKLYYPYHALVMNSGTSGSKAFVYGKLLKEEKKNPKPYAYSDMPIPLSYTAVGVKAVDGSAGTDFDNEHPSLTDVYDAFDALVTAYPNYVSKEDLGTDQSGTYHIYAYYFTPEEMTASSTYYRLPYPKINILAGIHGSNENCENVFALYYLMKSLCDSWDESDALEYLRWNVRFAVVPVQNPYGYVNSSRQNSRGVDLNRNFSIGWKQRESGTSEYGGTEPMSEAETVIIANFAEANKDAIFSVDLHGTGNSAQAQDSMIYCGTDPTDDMFYVCKSLITKLSHYWDSLNISGLVAANFHGFITGSIEGDGTQRAYMFAEKGIHSMVLEAFKNFTSSPYSNNSEEIMQMNADKLGYCLLYGLEHFRQKN